MESHDPGPDTSRAAEPEPAVPGHGASRWEQSFAAHARQSGEHTRRGGSSRKVSWVIGGVVAVIILTFVLAALL
ncbi:MAG TPA: hypothetical protein VND44_05555 [Acidimicrobiales bacterium]|nr:hypothetical protein [Acidimicrobiales bacterium]